MRAQRGPLPALLRLAILALATCAMSEETLTGSYTMKGDKGPITLTLTQDAQGGVQGQLKGGGVAFSLHGAPVPGMGLMGVASDAQGQPQSYFQLARRGQQLQLDLMGENADGEPDMTKKTTLLLTPDAPPPSATATASPAVPPTPAPTGNPFGQAAPAPAPFAGSFRGPELVMDSQVTADGSYQGTLTLNGQAMPFTARALDGQLTGTFTTQGQPFPFTARRDGAELRFTSAGTTLVLQAPAAPVAGPSNPFGQASPGAAATTPAANWKTFKHATGLSIGYPATWTLAEAPGVPGMLLTPPDAEKNQEGPQELYLVIAASAEGLKDVKDPRYYAQLVAQMTQLAPHLQVNGQPQALEVSGQPGLAVTWSGKHPTHGHAVGAAVYGTILKTFSVGILALGKQERITQRDATLRAIFSTLVAGASERDQAVVGKWKHWTYKSSANGSYSSERTTWLTLLADGTCHYSTNSESSASLTGKDSLGDTTWTAGFAGQGGDRDTGTWSAANGQAFVIWQSGSSQTASYKVSGQPGSRKLVLQQAGSKDVQEYMESR